MNVVPYRLTGVEFDHEVRFHLNWVWNVFEFRRAKECCLACFCIDFDILRNIALRRFQCRDNQSHLTGLFLDLDLVAWANLVRTDCYCLTVNRYVTVGYELTGSKDCRYEFRTVDDCIQTALKQADQVFAGVAFQTNVFLIVTVEFLLADVGVVAFQLLFCHQLDTVIGWLRTACAVHTRTCLTGVKW